MICQMPMCTYVAEESVLDFSHVNDYEDTGLNPPSSGFFRDKTKNKIKVCNSCKTEIESYPIIDPREHPCKKV